MASIVRQRRERIALIHIFRRSIHLSEDLQNIVQRFSEHYHEQWAVRKAEQGWQYGERFCDELRAHPRLKPYNLLQEWEKERYKEPIRDLLKAVLAIGWRLEPGDQPRSTGPIFHVSKNSSSTTK